MSKNDDINLKVQKVKKSKKSLLSLIASAVTLGLSSSQVKAISYTNPPALPGPILVPVAPIAAPPTPTPIAAPPVRAPITPVMTC